MKGGNLSNKHAPIIAFRSTCFVNYIQVETKRSAWERLKSIFSFDKSPEGEWKANQANIRFLRHLWRNRDYTIHIYFVGPEYLREDVEDSLDSRDVPYSRVIAVEDRLALRVALANNYTMYYFDTNEEDISVISTTKIKALPFDQASLVL